MMKTLAQKQLECRFNSILERLDSGATPLCEDTWLPSIKRLGGLCIISTQTKDDRQLLCIYHPVAPEIADFYIAEKFHEYNAVYSSQAKIIKSLRF